MTYKTKPGRDTFQSHVYSRPPGDLGFESFNRATDVRARSDRSVSPMIGRQKHNFLENYFPVQNVYEVASNLSDNTAELVFQSKGELGVTDGGTDQYFGDTITLVDGQGNTKTFEFITNGGVTQGSNIAIEEDGTDSISSLAAQTVRIIQQNFPLNQSNQTFVVSRNGLIVYIKDLTKNYGTTSVSIGNVSSNVPTLSTIDFKSQSSDDHEWFLKGQRRTTSEHSRAFQEGPVHDLMNTSRQRIDQYDDGESISGHVFMRRDQNVVYADKYPLGDATQESLGSEFTSQEIRIGFDTQFETLLNSYRENSAFYEDYWWHGRASNTWDAIFTLYGYTPGDDTTSIISDYISQDNLLMRNSPAELENGTPTGDIDVFHHLYSMHRGIEIPDERKYMAIVEGEKNYQKDAIDVNRNSWDIRDQLNGDVPFDDMMPGALVAADILEPGISDLALSTTIALPMVTDETETVHPFSDGDAWSGIDDAMLSVITGTSLLFQERVRYELPTKFYSNTGSITSQANPTQGIIYTGIGK